MKLIALTKLERHSAIAEVEKALADNPLAAAEFDKAAGGRHKRRAEIENCLALLSAKGSYGAQKAELQSKLAAAKARIAELAKSKPSTPKATASISQMALSEFRNLSPSDRMAFVKSGGKITK